jgi:pyruvate/2-oxoglutarate dehydrogenase complex dihydrolipoamide acyltransferase (E2) component
MAVEITIPKLGLTMTEATLVNWSIGAGARVTKSQMICIIETDKVSLEMEAPAAGLVHPMVEPGRRVAVGELIGYVAENEAELETLQARHEAVQTLPVPAGQPPVAETAKPPPPETALPPRKAASGERIIASPAARKHAEMVGVDLATLWGSGPGGRIVLADVEKAAKIAENERFEDRFDFGAVASENEMRSVAETIAIRGIRKIVSRNMKLSLSNQAQLTLHTEASAGGLRDTRTLFNERLEGGQVPVSYNAIIVKAVACALRRYPMLNAVVDGREIKIWQQIHIGIAMDFGKGLIVPKMRNADTKSIRVIADELEDLVERGRQQKLLPDELQGGTFTITNLGGWDVDWFTPINNFPESAILGVGRIVEKPWVRDGTVVAEPRMALSLTFDHRIIDGVLGASFLKTLKERIEDTRLML